MAVGFQSEAQRRKMAELVKAGKVLPETFAEWEAETGDRVLPERKPQIPRKAARKKPR